MSACISTGSSHLPRLLQTHPFCRQRPDSPITALTIRLRLSLPTYRIPPTFPFRSALPSTSSLTQALVPSLLHHPPANQHEQPYTIPLGKRIIRTPGNSPNAPNQINHFRLDARRVLHGAESRVDGGGEADAREEAVFGEDGNRVEEEDGYCRGNNALVRSMRVGMEAVRKGRIMRGRQYRR